MNHEFDLTKEISQLPPINDGKVRPEFMEVSSQKSNTGTAFATGLQSYKWNVSSGTWWVPKKSYFALRCTISNVAGDGPVDDAQIAAQMGLVSNLFQSCEFRMGGKTVQRVTQFMPQVDALIHRTTKSKPYLDTMGEATNFWSNDSAVRIAEVNSTLGVDGRRVYKFDLIYKPPLMIMHSHDGALPSGNFEIVLQPKPKLSFKLGVVETTFSPTTTLTSQAQPGVDYEFSVDRLQLKVATIRGPRVDNGSYALSLDHVECQSASVNTLNLSQQYFSVSPATKALCIAYQDRRVEEGRISASRFSVQTADQNLPNLTSANLANRLSRLYVQYSGVQRPSPDADPEYISGEVDRTVERYYETQIDTGMMDDPAGTESLAEFQQRGPYYYFAWNRDSRDGSTRVQVNQEFTNGTDVSNMNVLLFSVSETSVKCTIHNGGIVNIDQIER